MGGPEQLKNTLQQIQRYIVGWFLVSGVLLIAAGGLAVSYFEYDPLIVFGVLIILWIVLAWTIGLLVANAVSSPLKQLSQAILHISPQPQDVKPAEIDKLQIGRELVIGLVKTVYDLNLGSQELSVVASNASLSLQQLPVAVISIDQKANIKFANAKARELAFQDNEMVGNNLYGLFDIFFPDEDTLETWMAAAHNGHDPEVQKIWRGIRINQSQGEPLYIDLAASYSRRHNDGNEVLLALFDETNVYADQDNALSFVALAVHELRTPLTILRGYIEVIEEELKQNPKPEMQQLIARMKFSAENLTAFVGNILDVAKVDQQQLSLKLEKENWQEILGEIMGNMRIRGEMYGKNIELDIASGLPPVGIDRISIAEVMTNLIDNAIKYSPPDKNTIKVSSSLNQEGVVETTIQDFGVGIPESVLTHLFEKYSRNPRNRGSIGGTGLGLYLCKALVAAHGGNIWVRSKEGEGSTFGFTILPYDKVATSLQDVDNNITRHQHGWIKNHSLSRR